MMEKCSFIKHFKTAATRLVAVALLATLLFVTVQSAQADGFFIHSDQNGEDAVTSTQWLYGDTLEIEKGGELRLDSSNRHGVIMQNGGNTVTNNGLISLESYPYHYYDSRQKGAILSYVSDGDIITNNGTIETDRFLTHGILSFISDGNKIINNGEIKGLYTGSHGIYSLDGDGNTIINNGSIETTGQLSDGIRSIGNLNAIINDGTILITTQWGDSRGIYSDLLPKS